MTVNIEYEAEKQLGIPYEEIINDVVCASLDYEGCPYEAEVNVVLTDNEEIHQVNKEYRNVDAPTDVLSFPMLEYDTPSDFDHVEEDFADCFNPETGELMLGDIMISVDKVEEQAEKYGHSTTRELAFLVAHSMLHLCGYDHMVDEERLVMEAKQNEILEEKGTADEKNEGFMGSCSGNSVFAYRMWEKEEYVAVPESKITVEKDPVQVTTAPEPETETEPETIEEPEKRIAVDGKIKSYLTGEMIDVAKADRRPVAVMMSNDKAALPQYGINRAGVVYEAPVEGGMNRYMAILEDYDDLDRIGSVRSCRTYYTYFAREFDAIYAHFGQSTFALPYLDNVDNINGIKEGSQAFYRSSDKKTPHNAYTSAQKLQKTIEQLGYSQTYDPSYHGHFRFTKNGEEIHLENSLEAEKVVPGYALNNAYFQYDEQDGLYHRYQYGGVHKGSEGPITVKNIIFQYCSTGHYATTEYLNIDVHTSQYGYYITNGRAIPVSWKKDGEFGVTHYYNTENEEITLNQGKTWICIIPTVDFPKTEIHGKNN